MLTPMPLRPELVTACRYVAQRPAGRIVRQVQSGAGILSELVSGRGRQ